MARFILKLATLLAGASAAIPVASALPLGQPWEADLVAAQPVAPALAATNIDFTSIIALSNCSGSYVRFTSSKSSDKALVLTNGHCLESGFIPNGKAVVGQSSDRSFSLLSSDGSYPIGFLQAEEVVYATMTGTDVTLYRLTQTYDDITRDYGVQPLTIAAGHPEPGTPISIVSGFWRRIYTCKIDRFVGQLREGEWTFSDSILFKQPGCNTIGGTSGSPIINVESREIVGINNTINQSGESCTVNNPCEVNVDGAVRATRGAAYGQELYQFYACLGDNNTLDLNKTGCSLTKPAGEGLTH